MGFKREDINDNIVENLASYGHTINEIADILSCSRHLIAKTHREAYRRGLGNLRHDARTHLKTLAFAGKGIANMKALHKLIDMIFPQLNNPVADPYEDNIHHSVETIRIEFVDPDNAIANETETTISTE